MLFKLAWRNIWRNKRRSMVVLVSVIVGVIMIMFFDGLMNGMLYQMLFNQISSNVAHIQIHKDGYSDKINIHNYIPEHGKIEEALENTDGITAWSRRGRLFGLLSSAESSSGIYLNGVEYEAEKKISSIHGSMIEGNYLSGKKGEIIIGRKLAEKLNVKPGSKVVGYSNKPDGSIGTEIFRITGIFQTFSSQYDESNIFISLTDLQRMLDMGDRIFEYAILTDNYKNSSVIASNLKESIGDDRYEILTYEDLLPFVIVQMNLYFQMMMVINIIIGMALIFGIINAMLMSVFERINEIGVLMSIGMKNSRIFMMIEIEALLLGGFGTLIGVLAGYLITIPLAAYGIDFSWFAESLSSLGVGSVVYPALSMDNLVAMLVTIPLVAVIGAIYPAWRALKLEPVYAIRYV